MHNSPINNYFSGTFCCMAVFGYRFDKNTLDYGQVAEVTFWEFRFKKKIGSYELDQIRSGRIAKYSCV